MRKSLYLFAIVFSLFILRSFSVVEPVSAQECHCDGGHQVCQRATVEDDCDPYYGCSWDCPPPTNTPAPGTTLAPTPLPNLCACDGSATLVNGAIVITQPMSPVTDECIRPDFLPRCTFKPNNVTHNLAPTCKCEYAKFCNSNGQRYLDPPNPAFMLTALGCIPISSGPLLSFLLSLLSGIGGGIALLLIIYAAFMISTAGGDPKKVQAGKELLTAALIGLAFITLAVVILNFFGVNVLGLQRLGLNIQT